MGTGMGDTMILSSGLSFWASVLPWKVGGGTPWFPVDIMGHFFLNKIPVYCWTLFHTYIKQAKKINSNFIDKKKEEKKRNLLSLAFLTISYKPTTYSTARYIHKKSYWNARNKIVFLLSFLFFLQGFFFSFEIIMNMVTPQVRSEVGQRTL